jgi:hypothetical protein
MKKENSLSFGLRAYDDAFARLYDEVAEHLHMQDEILRNFPIAQVDHDGRTRMQSEPSIFEASFRKHSESVPASWEMIQETNAHAFKTFLLALLLPIQESKRRQTEEIISATADATGNVIDTKNRDIWESYIEMIEKVSMRFDDDGTPDFFVYPLEFRDRLRRAEPPTPEQKSQIEQIIRKKETEFWAKRKRRLK